MVIAPFEPEIDMKASLVLLRLLPEDAPFVLATDSVTFPPSALPFPYPPLITMFPPAMSFDVPAVVSPPASSSVLPAVP